jgi:NAD(P)-dependent dehydrogenase (short-subunit alcohol dehydrogenase family)
MTGKTVVITGGTSGIGQVAAAALAAKGARLVLVARSRGRAEETLAKLRAQNSRVTHSVHYADLSRVGEVKRVGEEIAAREPRVDVLINNAGAMFAERQVTDDGLEMTFATNHMAYFVLTHMLRERLLAAGAARVVSTASHAHKGMKLNFADLQMATKYSGFRAYGRSKLCNILFTRELAKRLAGTGITANSLHPGFVNTRFGDNSGGGIGAAVFGLLKKFALSPEKGAETIVWLASADAPAKISGAYFYKCKETEPTAEARDDESARRLWQETANLVGLES